MRWIGIDFGTTNSAAAMLEQGRLVETLDPGGKHPVPSVIAYHQERYRCGFEAWNASLDPNDQSLIITGMKQALGRAPELRVSAKTFLTQALVAEYLKSLIARLFGGRSPGPLGAVIGTPVEFPASHRYALLAAAKDAGITAVEFVYEPTAAVYAAVQGGEFPRGPVGVIDWGGGTVDITLVRCATGPDRIEDLNVNARRQGLGGRDLDRRILDRALSRSTEARTWFDSADRSTQNRILSRLERGKIRHLSGLSLGPHADFWLENVPSELYPHFRLTTEMIEESLDGFIDQIKRLAVETTRKADLAVEDVSHYLLVGGPPQSALIQRRLKNIWPQAKELAVENRQRATVRGCALLAERGFELALSADIAVRQFDNHLHFVLRKGQPFPRGGQGRYREYKYRVTDLAAPQAVLEIGQIPERGQYEPLEVLSVPVIHRQNPDDRSVLPYDICLRVGLNEYLYVTATALGRVQSGKTSHYVEVCEHAELSRIPLALVPGTKRSIR
jgi:molecular chaperone DnaK (HSP70)